VLAPLTLTPGLRPKKIDIAAKAERERDGADDDQRTSDDGG
jgi:hypothetical protein